MPVIASHVGRRLTAATLVLAAASVLTAVSVLAQPAVPASD